MVIQVYDARTFRDLHLSVPDVYFTAEYGAAEEAAGAGEWLMLEAFDGKWLMPVHLRHGDLATDGVSPYGYAGVYASPELTRSQERGAWSEARAALAARGCVSIFLRQSPLLEGIWSDPTAELVVDAHPTVLVDVGDLDDAWRKMEGRCRTSIRKAEKIGFATSVRPAAEQDVAAGSPFRLLYEAAMVRRGATDRYMFSDDYYERLLSGLQSNLLIAQVETPGFAEVVAASLFMRHGTQLHYHLSASDPDAGRQGATNELVWATMKWAHTSGIRTLHLGGGVGRDDSLLKFKSSFGGDILKFNAYGVVVDEPAYRQAVTARAAQLAVPVSELCETAGVFPRFRASV